MDNNEPEIWKDIPGYEGLYKINNNGVVKSYDRIKSSGRGLYTLPGRIIKIHYRNKCKSPFVQLNDKNGNSNSKGVNELLLSVHNINSKHSELSNLLQSEEWKDIEGFEGLYQVSDMGRIKYLSKQRIHRSGKPYTQKGGIKKTFLSTNKNPKYTAGYVHVTLTDKNGKLHPKSVARLVGFCFVPGYFEGAEINHKFGNKLDNRATQLEWTTGSYNKSHAAKTGLNPGKTGHTGKKNVLSKKVSQYDLSGTLIKVWDGTREAERNGYNSALISSVATGRKKTHKGFIWKYDTPDPE
ncbi:MAG: hypothetical protein JWO92_2541 [Chitinophagaceae bacterium]|nr:hypothetical protein [Chitinophagaceae bacterium]